MLKEITEYQMRVYVFGNSPSPAITIYGTRCAALESEQEYGSDTHQFVERHFHVHDGLISLANEADAINLRKRTQTALTQSNLKLHKIASNSVTVMKSFPPDDLAKDVKDLDHTKESLQTQSSLGLCLNMDSYTFTFQVTNTEKPFTCWGVFFVVNCLFDPLGLVASVPLSTSKEKHSELYIFSDASNKAIAAVAYLQVITEHGLSQVGFVFCTAKLASQPEPTIPRLELCGAALAVDMAELILEEIDFKPDAVKFYFDSKVVLGYIFNETRHFFVYVHNRAQQIHVPEQWHFIPTDHNPADLATKSVSPSQLANKQWFTGPAFLHKPFSTSQEIQKNFELIKPELGAEIQLDVTSLATLTTEMLLT